MLMKPTEELDASETVWFGDPIDSIRSMMKRYTYYRTTAIPVNYAANEYQSTYAIRWTFPHAPQYGNAVAAGGGDYNDPAYAGTGGNVRTGRDTLIALFGACFLQWRGGIRHKFVLEPQAQTLGITGTSRVSQAVDQLMVLTSYLLLRATYTRSVLIPLVLRCGPEGIS